MKQATLKAVLVYFSITSAREIGMQLFRKEVKKINTGASIPLKAPVLIIWKNLWMNQIENSDNPSTYFLISKVD